MNTNWVECIANRMFTENLFRTINEANVYGVLFRFIARIRIHCQWCAVGRVGTAQSTVTANHMVHIHKLIIFKCNFASINAMQCSGQRFLHPSIRMDHGSSGRKCNSYFSIGRMFRNKIAKQCATQFRHLPSHTAKCNRLNIWHVLAARSTQRELQIKRMHFRRQWPTVHTTHSKCSSALVRIGSRTPLCDLRAATQKRYIMIKLNTMTIGIRLPIVVLIKIQFKLKCDNAITVDCAFGR